MSLLEKIISYIEKKEKKYILGINITLFRYLFSLTYLALTISSQNVYVFLGSSGRCLKGPAVSSASHRNDDEYNLDNIRRFLLSAGPSGNSRTLRPLVLPRALLQHGHVFLRPRQVNI